MAHSTQEGTKSPTRWRVRKPSTQSNEESFSFCLEKLSKFCTRKQQREELSGTTMCSPSRRVRSLRTQRTELLAKKLFEEDKVSGVMDPRNWSDEQHTSAPQVLLSWTAIDFRYVKYGCCVSSQIEFKSDSDRPLIVRLTLDSSSSKYSPSQIRPLILSQRHIKDETKKLLLEREVANSQAKERMWKLEDPRSGNR